MNLENTVKYHFAKSTLISDSPRATASDSLTGTDIMAAMGMTQERAAMGYSAFLGKMGISNNDRDRAIGLLAEYALTKCDKVAALRKLSPTVKPKVIRILAEYAFEDYSRSASSKKNMRLLQWVWIHRRSGVHQQSNVSGRQTAEVGQSYKGGLSIILGGGEIGPGAGPGALPKVQGKRDC